METQLLISVLYSTGSQWSTAPLVHGLVEVQLRWRCCTSGPKHKQHKRQSVLMTTCAGCDCFFHAWLELRWLLLVVGRVVNWSELLQQQDKPPCWVQALAASRGGVQFSDGTADSDIIKSAGENYTHYIRHPLTVEVWLGHVREQQPAGKWPGSKTSQILLSWNDQSRWICWNFRLLFK